jgi:hypothetical protein
MNTRIAWKLTDRLAIPILLAGVWLMNGCSAPQTSGRLALSPGAGWQEVARVAGPSTGRFSYQMNGRKYDLIGFEKAQSPMVFEDCRLYAVVSREAMAEWDRRVTACMQREQLPFEKGLGPIHSWVMEQRRLTQRQGQPREPDDSMTSGDVAEAAAAAVILTPIAPILLAGGVVGASEYAMTGKDRQRAKVVNDALVGSGISYAAFLSQLPKPDMAASKGSYRVSEYLITQGSFFTWNKYFYDVGVRDGRVSWVAYQSDAIRQKTYQYWRARRPP